jgi:prepilin-type N-terminal cleavage/methylation domain-containing protein
MRTIPKKYKAFTLIELIIVVVIIALLSAVVVANLNNQRMRSRNSRRISDIRQLQSAVESYANDNDGGFPYLGSSLCMSWTSDSVPGGSTCWQTNLKTALANYLPNIQTPPGVGGDRILSCVDGTKRNNAYYYFSEKSGNAVYGANYKIIAQLEGKNGDCNTEAINDGGSYNDAFEVYSAGSAAPANFPSSYRTKLP